MSWDREAWARRDREVDSARDASIYYPREDLDFIPGMEGYLKSRSLDHKMARVFGWYPAFYHGPRIIIPCQRTDYKNFWQGRLIEDPFGVSDVVVHPKRWESPHGPRGDAVCYLRTPYIHMLVVCEGPMDALAAAMTGAAAVALLGVAPSGPVIAHAAKIAKAYRRVIIVPDRDELGQWIMTQTELGQMGVHSEVREPSAKDLADLSPAKRKELIYG